MRLLVELGEHAALAIWHAKLDLSWRVMRIVEDWCTPRFADVTGTLGETRRARVMVRGPLPGRPSEDEDFVMII